MIIRINEIESGEGSQISVFTGPEGRVMRKTLITSYQLNGFANRASMLVPLIAAFEYRETKSLSHLLWFCLSNSAMS